MPLSQWNLEFLNHNAQRSYPLTDDSSKTDTSGAFTIPNDFLVMMDVPVSTAMDMETGRFFIRQIGLFASGVQLIVAYDSQSASSIVDVATALIPTSNFTRNKVVSLNGIEPYDDINGKVVIGRIDTIQAQPSGLFEFTLEGTRLEPQVVRPMIRGITSLSVSNSVGTVSDRYYGDIELVAGNNIQLSVIPGTQSSQIIISAINGEGTVNTCVCEGDAVDVPCIKTINNVAPTPDGNFNFLGNDCIEFIPLANGIKVIDKCCSPCCGCPELEAITKDLERFANQRSLLELFVNQLATEVATFDTTVLGSRLGDRRCLTCS